MARGPVRLHRRWRADIGDHVVALEWAPKGQGVAAASVAGPVSVYDPATGSLLVTCPGHPSGTMSLSWRRDGESLVSGGQDGLVCFWGIPSGEETAQAEGGAAWVEHVRWHPSEAVVASAAGRKMRLWSADGRLIRAYPDHPRTISDLAWRPSTGELTSATYGRVALWSMAQDEPVQALEWKGSILKLVWAPNGAHLAHGNQDATVHYWSLPAGRELQMAGYPMKVRELTFDTTGRYLATGGGEAVTVWDCKPPGPEGTTPLSFQAHTGPITSLGFQPGGPLLASGGQDGKVNLLQPGKFKRPLATSDLGQGVAKLAWSPDGRLLAVGGERGAFALYSVV